MERTIHELGELESVALEVLGLCAHEHTAHILALTGDLGAGKTAFVQALARTLGIKEAVTSPTFVIMKSYPIHAHAQFDTLVHIDAYRIEDEDELRVLQFDTIIGDPRTLVALEWPERIPHTIRTIPKDQVVSIAIEIGGAQERTIRYGRQ